MSINRGISYCTIKYLVLHCKTFYYYFYFHLLCSWVVAIPSGLAYNSVRTAEFRGTASGNELFNLFY